MLADVILVWSGGGICCPSFSRSGEMEWSGTDFLEWSEKRSSLRKNGAYPSLGSTGGGNFQTGDLSFTQSRIALETVFTGILFNLTGGILGKYVGEFLILLNCHPAPTRSSPRLSPPSSAPPVPFGSSNRWFGFGGIDGSWRIGRFDSAWKATYFFCIMFCIVVS